MESSLNQTLAEALLKIVCACTREQQPSADVLKALRETIGETTKAGHFEQLEAKVEDLAKQVRSLKTENALRNPQVR